MGRLKGEELIKKKVATLARLEMNGGNIAKTAKEMKTHRSTIRIWLKANSVVGARIKAEKERKRRELAQQQQEAIAEGVETVVKLSEEKLESLVAELIEEMRHKMGTGKFSEVSIGMGIAYDKLQNLKGRPSVISQSVGNLSEEERATRAAELIAKGRQRRLNAGGQAMAIVPNPGEGNGNGSTG